MRHLSPPELSGGMSRRVALMTYDEPFTGLDPISLSVILRLIRRLNNALGLTSIIVSHGVEEVTKVADVVCQLSAGKAIACGRSAHIRNFPSEAARQFMTGGVDGPTSNVPHPSQ
jgi:phospholipid/cholesterol/gamma-HCH transport system ATP-binding protein